MKISKISREVFVEFNKTRFIYKIWYILIHIQNFMRLAHVFAKFILSGAGLDISSNSYSWSKHENVKSIGINILKFN